MERIGTLINPSTSTWLNQASLSVWWWCILLFLIKQSFFRMHRSSCWFCLHKNDGAQCHISKKSIRFMVQGSCISDNRNLFHQLETYMENNVAIKTIIEPNIFSNNIWTPIWRVIRKTHNVQLLKAYGIKNKRRTSILHICSLSPVWRW